jgi:hypothetical protein
VHRYDPQGVAWVERLRLARHWRDEGSIDQGLAAYGDMLDLWAGRPAADAAAEELLELQPFLERQEQYYTALAVVRHMEEFT